MIVRNHIVYLFVSLLIVCSKCCISLNSGECSLGRTFFGGRLVLTGKDGPGLCDTSQQFIFVTPFGLNSFLKSTRGFGRGRIWMGKRNCLGYGTQSQDYCSLADSRPCLDKTVPCFSTPPSYSLSHPLQFSNVTKDSITVTWPAWNATTDSGVGPVTQYRIQYREEGGNFTDKLLNACTLSHRFDGLEEGKKYEFRIILIRKHPPADGQPSLTQNKTLCGDLGDLDLVLSTESRTAGRARIIVKWQIRTLPELCEVSQQSITIHQVNDNCILPTPGVDETNSLKTSRRQKTFQRLDANWNFNITLQVTNPSGVYMSSKVQRTAETRPEGPPINVASVKRENSIEFRWEEPQCHLCHGDIVDYRYTVQKNDLETDYFTTKEKSAIYDKTPWSKVKFKVRARTSKGLGPFSPLMTV